MQITNCRVNHLVNPIGYMLEEELTFSFVTEEAKGKRQTAARIVVAEDATLTSVLVDTGFAEDIDSLGTKVKVPLKPRQKYYWQVTVKSDANEVSSSEIQCFETGKMEEPWAAKWITCENADRLPVFSKRFEAEKEVVEARLYISGLGLYHALFNGKEVTRERLTPYYTNYDAWVQYQTYDVTGLLEKENEIAVTLGKGWYSGRFGFYSKVGGAGYYGSDYKLIAELHLMYADGSEDVIGTDEHWDVTRSNITDTSIYDGERRDDTLAPVPPVKAQLCEKAALEKINLKERLSLPVLPHEELDCELLHTPAGETVFDTHQNLAGMFTLRVCEPAGTKIHIQMGEVLQQGNFYNENLRTAKAEYIYIADGSEQTICPVFTFYGFRYAKVSGVRNLAKEDFKAIAYYSDITPAGELVTGNDKINRLISNVKWGQKGNFVDVPTDCPQRDERMGWTADTQVFVPTACYFTDSYAFYRKWLYEVRGEQRLHDGACPDVVPATGVGGGCSVWGDAATIVPWTLYEYFGDKAILEESIDAMADWVDYISRVDGDDHGYERIFHYGDWLALDNATGKKDECAGGTSEAYIADVYYLHSARLTAKAARILGRKDLYEKYEALSVKLSDYIQKEFFTPNGRLAIDTQTGYILALKHHLFDEHKERIVAGFLNALERRGGNLCTGFVGTPFLCQELSKMERDDLAYNILLNETYPGWLYEIGLGATTVWERWNSMEEDGSVSSTGMNSFNHYAYGSIAEWMWKTIGGISPIEDAPGFRKAYLRPIPNTEIGFGKAVYHSPAGCYQVSWDIPDETHVHISVTVPFDCSATLELPFTKEGKKIIELEAGSYEYTYETEAFLNRIMTVDDVISDILSNKRAVKALEKVFPGLEKVPGHMQGMTLRELLTKVRPEALAQVDQINNTFKMA